MVLPQALRPGREGGGERRADHRALRHLHVMPLTVVEADGFDVRVAGERPSQAHGGVLATGEKNEGCGLGCGLKHGVRPLGVPDECCCEAWARGLTPLFL